ncbi:MAG: hypothetical protein HFI20_05075 [Lachnospiraceae bacterium]|nr:hypothetical protein [Lachnospiraceae bacterium]MCI9017681.1 hypothetical protein [Lachnospiraceae bacterium]MCI9307733.1 hypothetical protein [Lachnospiraceae bacterium]
MKKDPAGEEKSAEKFWEIYERLSGQGKEMAAIMLKIGSSNILTEREFEILIKALMGKR